MIKNYAICLLIIVATTISYAQDIDTAKLNHYFDALAKNHKFMGSVAVTQNGQMVYRNSLGFTDVDSKQKADSHTKYRIGSISKTFTSVLVMKAVEQNKLKLDQTIKKFFPTLLNAPRITIKQLLGHRSGIHSFTNDDDYLTWNTQAKSENEMMAIITKGGSDFEPDSKAEYSNSNYVLLTFILEKTFKKSYATLIQQYIAKPLGLKDTYLGSKINVANNESQSYKFANGWQLEKETDISIPLGAGGILSTPCDLVLFSDALFSNKLLKEESLTQMKTITENYGLGLFQIPFYDKKAYGHTGGIDGFTSVFSHFSEGNVSYALTSNGTNYNNNGISIAVLSAVFGKPFDLPDFTSYTVNPTDLDHYLGTYTSKDIPLKITIFKQDNKLMAQATGQAAFTLKGTAKDVFKFEPAQIVISFSSAEKSMELKQGGGTFNFTKQQEQQ